MAAPKKKSTIAVSPVRPDRKQELKWQAEEDARTLSRASEITSDRARLTRAKKIAQQQAADAAKVAKKLGKP